MRAKKYSGFYLILILLGCLANCAKEEKRTVLSAEAGRMIERLGRPAINEGLVISNAFLNAFNSIPPSADLSDAAAPVRGEVARTLDAVDALDGAESITVEAVVAAFLPDVMRLDFRVGLSPGATAYNSCQDKPTGILCGGRKIKDDVVDITLSLLVAGDPTGKAVKDNVFYSGVRGNSAQPGKRPLLRRFPYLAAPR